MVLFFLGFTSIFLTIYTIWLGHPDFERENYIWNFYKNSFNFSGKTKRRDFWITELWLLLICLFFVWFGFAIYLDLCRFGDCDFRPYILIPFYGFSMISGIPNIAIQVRRLRDAAKNPMWLLISLVPLIGTITLLIFYASPSREKRLPMTLQDRLSEVEDLLNQGTIDEEEYKYMRKKILTKYVD